MKFKTGDRVKIITHNYGKCFYGLIGIIVDDSDDKKSIIFDNFPTSKYSFFDDDLEKM